MSNSISGPTRRMTPQTGNRVSHSALGSPAQHARKNLLRKKKFQSSARHEDSDSRSEGSENRLDEQGEQPVLSARSLATTVNYLQRATNLIGSTETALDTLVTESNALLSQLERNTSDWASPSDQPLSAGLQQLAATLGHMLVMPLANGEPLFSPHGPYLLREILAGINTEKTLCSDYARIVNQATGKLQQWDYAVAALSARPESSNQILPMESIDNLLRRIVAGVSVDRKALLLLQDSLSRTLQDILTGAAITESQVAKITTPSTHQALSERTSIQLLSRPGAASIYNDVESDLVESLLRD